MRDEEITEIPHKIHYCWFGGAEKSELITKCIKSWKKFFPTWEIIEWNEKNFDLSSCDYAMEAYRCKKWAFVSDYVRTKIMYEEGGVYFDTDVEVIRDFDDLLAKGPILACQGDPSQMVNTSVAPGLVMACRPKMELLAKILSEYEHEHFLIQNKENMRTIVSRYTDILNMDGMIKSSEVQYVDGFYIYPAEFFSPMHILTKEIEITDNTRTIHYFAGSWISGTRKYKQLILRCIYRLLGKKGIPIARAVKHYFFCRT